LDDAKKKVKTVFRELMETHHMPLFMLILITVVLIAYLLTIQIRIGVPYWDVFNYLNNALFFAGINGGGVTTYLPPLIPF